MLFTETLVLDACHLIEQKANECTDVEVELVSGGVDLPELQQQQQRHLLVICTD